MRLLGLAAILAVLCIGVAPGTGSAEIFGNYIHPYASVTGMYDSNLFRVRSGEDLRPMVGDDRKSDFITSLALGVNIEYPISQQQFSLTAEHDFLWYSHYSQYNSSQDTLRGAANLRIADRVIGLLSGSYVRMPQPFGDYTGFQKAINTTQGFDAFIGYEFPWGFTLKGGGGVQSVSYSTQALIGSEYTAPYGFVQGIYKISPKTQVDLQYRRDSFNYKVPDGLGLSRDSVQDLIQGGVIYDITAKTRFDLHLGYLNRRYDSPVTKNFGGIVGKFTAKYALTEKTQLSAWIERNLAEEAFIDQTYSDYRHGGLDVSYRLTAKTLLNAGAELGNKVFKGDNQFLFTLLDPRHDWTHSAYTGVQWSVLERLLTGLNYRYTSRNSNYQTYDYKDHTVDLTVKYQF
ncbi:MAG TPA: outer membrane beta-barrel protein [Dissulfurispiraceae bacterium]|nr:outer membrane beta-barrel protein [Dissulfurispiraceae bacterium]